MQQKDLYSRILLYALIVATIIAIVAMVEDYQREAIKKRVLTQGTCSVCSVFDDEGRIVPAPTIKD